MEESSMRNYFFQMQTVIKKIMKSLVTPELGLALMGMRNITRAEFELITEYNRI